MVVHIHKLSDCSAGRFCVKQLVKNVPTERILLSQFCYLLIVPMYRNIILAICIETHRFNEMCLNEKSQHCKK